MKKTRDRSVGGDVHRFGAKIDEELSEASSRRAVDIRPEVAHICFRRRRRRGEGAVAQSTYISDTTNMSTGRGAAE